MVCLMMTASANAAIITRVDYWRNGSDTSNGHQHVIQYDTIRGQQGDLWWRGGSGTGSKDGCATNRGWIPAGYGDLRGHWDSYGGSAIRGRVWYIDDRLCATGRTLRTELFVHSEETDAWTEDCRSGPDDPFCWEGVGDYRSNGCIKVAHDGGAPTDIAQMNNAWHSWDNRHGAFVVTNGVYVYGQ
jgi:hypothetical protein